MEFWVNGIDTTLRKKVNDETSSGKIHAKQSIVIDNNNQQKEREFKKSKKQEKKKFNIEKYSKKNISIDAVKVKTVKVQAEKESRAIGSEDEKGIFIDNLS